MTESTNIATTTSVTQHSFGERLRRDLPASLVVFLVAVPLSLGIAAASGAPIAAGLIAAAVGGILAGIFGGAPLQVSGPAAGLTVIVASLAAQFPWPVVCAVTFGAGLLQLLLSISRVARLALAISPVVVNAMLAGIGVTIILQQIQVMLGGTSKSSAWENVLLLPKHVSGMNPLDLLCGLSVIALIMLWARLPASVRKVPGQLVAIVLVTIASVLFALDVTRVEVGDSILDAIALPQLPDGEWGAFLLGVLTVGIVASIESLLSAVAVDRLHEGKRTNFDRELFGQGVANSASGLLGGLPVTGVIVRSSTNVVAGAVSNVSAIMHGVWVAVFSVLGVALIESIPTAALAGLLVYTGAKLIRWADIHVAGRTGDLLVYVATIVGVVALNLLEGVGIGVALSIVILLWRVVNASVHAEELGPNRWRVVIEGTCSFLSTPRLVGVLQSIPEDVDVIVELEVDYLDRHAFQALEDWRARHQARGRQVTIEQHTHDVLGALDSQPPRRSGLRSMVSGALAPWQDQGRELPTLDTGSMHLSHLLPVYAGIDQFHRKRAGMVNQYLEPLALTQRPEAMFITCADSRVVPSMITNSGPGDLFTVRNVGNLIPTCHAGEGHAHHQDEQHIHGQGSAAAAHGDASVESAVTFAVESLGVQAIVVCGHSACGAMSSLLTGISIPDDLDAWLEYGRESLDTFRANHPLVAEAKAAGYTEADQLSIVNVMVQLERLRRHPSIAAGLEAETLSIAGLFFDVSASRVVEITADALVEVGQERMPTSGRAHKRSLAGS